MIISQPARPSADSLAVPGIVERRILWDLLRPQRGGSLRQMRRKSVVDSSSCKDTGTCAEDETRHDSLCVSSADVLQYAERSEQKSMYDESGFSDLGRLRTIAFT